MGIVLGILVALAAWWFLKLSFWTIVLFVIVGAIVGAIPTFMRRTKSKMNR